MDKLKNKLYKPILITIGALAVLPVTPVALCLLYGWVE
jgi:hypothetical protein|tara:strand:- start:18014 stop:18127 length:114 start_codon:yes stop_codon:yes gene_type:complete